MASVPAVVTDVGYTGFGQNYVRGISVRDELFGKDGFWSAYALSLGGPRLSRRHNELLDTLGVACIAGDPRIWPLKVTWLVASLGSPWAGVAAITASLPDATVGPGPAVDAARTCMALRKAAAAGDAIDGMLAWLSEQRREGRRVAGFGVPGGPGGRAEDERIELIRRAVREQGEAGPHFRLMEQLTGHLSSIRLKPNGALYLNAVLLDLGFSSEQCPMVVVQMFNLMIWAHAYESARLSPAVLQRLPPEAVRYVGAARRPSPRAAERG